MSIWTSLEPESAPVEAGGSTTVTLRLRNTADVVEEYRVVPVGDPSLWCSVEPATLRLYPGATGSVELTFSPPRSPEAHAGANPYGVQIVPTENPELTTVVEGNLTIAPFVEAKAELLPPTTRGRFRARPKLAVDNYGNTKLTASLSGRDQGSALEFDVRPGAVQIEPGRAAFVKVGLRPSNILWTGQKESHALTVAVQRSAATPIDVAGTFVQRPVFPRWLFGLGAFALVLAVAFVGLWLSIDRTPASQARQVASATHEPVHDGGDKSDDDGGDKSDDKSGDEKQELPKTPKTTPPPPAAPPPAPAAPSGGEKKEEQPRTGTIVGVTSKRCIEVPGSADPERLPQLQIFDCKPKGPDGQKWTMEKNGTIRSLGKCMDAANGSRENGTVVQLARCNGEPAQQFQYTKGHTLVNPQSGKCVDPTGGKDDNTTKLELWDCTGHDNQKWDLPA
ncbi:ricin-type beta-trefoil lectin domain protein [Streptomyces sp. NPDC021098]|uniref:ricin-type beta-trefoil lectin domain protein n=1 Tax=unclassified Streptomyces TaxID=2593676 RepID=UPI0037A2627F